MPLRLFSLRHYGFRLSIRLSPFSHCIAEADTLAADFIFAISRAIDIAPLLLIHWLSMPFALFDAIAAIDYADTPLRRLLLMLSLIRHCFH
jgi:hypothetical protein